MSPLRRAAAARWVAVAAFVAALAATPSVLASWPLAGSAASAMSLLQRARTAADAPYVGLVESRGSLQLPDVPSAGSVPKLLGETNRLRVWVASRQHARVDTLTDIGESDIYLDADGTTEWDSAHSRVTHVFGDPTLRALRSVDLLPPELGRRLASVARPSEVRRIPSRRIAGHDGLGVRITPSGSETTLARIDLYLDHRTSLPLEVEVTGRGRRGPSVTTRFLELAQHRPAASTLRFTPPETAQIFTSSAPDLAADADRFAPYQLPATLAGLPEQRRLAGLGDTGGAATYGRGYALLALIPLRHNLIDRAVRSLAPPVGQLVAVKGAFATASSLPLLSAVVVDAGVRGYLLAGTVSVATLRRAGQQLVDRPPPLRPGA